MHSFLTLHEILIIDHFFKAGFNEKFEITSVNFLYSI